LSVSHPPCVPLLQWQRPLWAPGASGEISDHGFLAASWGPHEHCVADSALCAQARVTGQTRDIPPPAGSMYPFPSRLLPHPASRPRHARRKHALQIALCLLPILVLFTTVRIFQYHQVHRGVLPADQRREQRRQRLCWRPRLRPLIRSGESLSTLSRLLRRGALVAFLPHCLLSA
jgi:hypothetical protein